MFFLLLSDFFLLLNIFGQVWSNIRKVSRCRLAISYETILATTQEFILTEVAPIQSITDILLE